MYGYIYKTTDKFTNKIYVGKLKSKYFKGIEYIGSGKIITNIKEKCLRENISISDRFKVELVDTAESKEELNEKEIYYISLFDSRNRNVGYNLSRGGDGGIGGPRFAGHRHSEETRKNMSLNRKGSKNANYGNRWHQSDELKELHSKLSSGKNNSMYGKKQSDVTKEKIALKKINKIAISFVELDKVKMIYPEDLNDYLKQGWIKGNIHARMYKK